jgi:hypothetical protein
MSPPKIIPRWELISDGGFEWRESRGDHNVKGMAQRVVEDCTSFHQKLNGSMGFSKGFSSTAVPWGVWQVIIRQFEQSSAELG